VASRLIGCFRRFKRQAVTLADRCRRLLGQLVPGGDDSDTKYGDKGDDAEPLQASQGVAMGNVEDHGYFLSGARPRKRGV
jgi:hypothetical protein